MKGVVCRSIVQCARRRAIYNYSTTQCSCLMSTEHADTQTDRHTHTHTERERERENWVRGSRRIIIATISENAKRIRLRRTTQTALVSNNIAFPCTPFNLVMGLYTENTEPISDIFKTDTDTDVSICNTEKYRISTIKYRNVGSVRYFIYSSLFHQSVA